MNSLFNSTFLFFFVLVVLILVFAVSSSELERDVKGFLSPQGPNLISGATLFTGTRQIVPEGPIGRKRALLFGLNYIGTNNQLQGCIQDVTNLRIYLTALGFTCDVYTDHTSMKPTHTNITNLITTFLNSMQPNDVGFLWYSGHGVYSNRQNCWVPLDHRSKGFLYESSFRNMILGLQDPSVRLFVGSDSCYSGSFFDLKYDIEPDGSIDVLQVRESVSGIKSVEFVAETHMIDRTVPMDDEQPFEETFVRSVLTRPTGGIRLFRDIHYKGPATTFIPVGLYTTVQLRKYGFQSRTASSVQVSSGFQVQLYATTNASGSSVVLRTSSPNLRNQAFNDRTSSIKVEYIPEAISSQTQTQVQNYSLYTIRASLAEAKPYVTFVSACRDNQVGYDAYIDGRTQGAMTWSFLKALRSNSFVPNGLTLGMLQDLMRQGLSKVRFPQVPQLSVGSPLSPFTSLRAFGLIP
jgi:hypothetical protein